MQDINPYAKKNPQEMGINSEPQETPLSNQFDHRTPTGFAGVTTTVQNMGGQIPLPAYNQPLNRPGLTPPLISPQQTADVRTQFTKQFLLHTLPTQLPPLPNDIQNELERQLNILSQTNNFTEEQEAQVNYGLHHPETIEDPEIKAFTEVILKQVYETLGKQQFDLPSDGQLPIDGEVFDQGVEQAYHEAFENQLAKVAKELGLTQEQVAQLRFAHYNPDVGVKSELLAKIEEAAFTQVKQNLKLPSNAKPPQVDNSEFNKKMAVDYELAFEKALKTHVPTLTNEQIGQLKYLHFNPDATFPGSEQLKELLAELENQAARMIKLGLPPDWRPSPTQQYFTATLSGAYQGALRQLMQEFFQTKTPPLTDKEKELIAAALEDPDDPSIPPEIKAIVATLIRKAIKQVVDLYNLPPTWTPEVKSLQPPASGASASLINGGMEYLNDVLKAATLHVNRMPDGPQKSVFLDFLKIIGEALSDLQQLLYVIQMADSKTAQMIVKAKMNAQIHKIELQKKEMEAAKKEASKEGAKVLSIIMRVITPLIMIITFVVALAFAWQTGGASFIFAAVVITAITALMIADSQTQCMSKFFEVIGNLAMEMCPSFIPEELKQIVSILAKVVCMVAVLVLCCVVPSVALTLLSSVGLPFIMSAVMGSGIVNQGIKACGGNEKDQQIAGMVVGITLAVTIGILCFFLQPSGGAKSGAKIAETSAKEAGHIAKATKAITEAIKPVTTAVKDSQVVVKATEAINAAKGEVAAITGAVTGTIKGGVQSATTAIKETQAVAKTTEALSSVAQEIKQTSQTVSDNIKNVLKQALESSQEVLYFEKADDLINYVKSMYEELSEVSQNAKQFISEICQNVKTDENFLVKQLKVSKELADWLADRLVDLAKSRGVGYVQEGLMYAQGGLSIATSAINLKLQMELAALAILRGKLQAEIEEIEALIKLYQKLITQLLDALQGISEWIKDINEMQGKKFSDLSATLTSLWQA